MFKFQKNDIFINRIKTYPKSHFFIYDTSVYYNNQTNIPQTSVPTGFIDLYELNPGRSSGLIYPFIEKGSSRESINSVSTSDFNSLFQFGDVITGSYPLSASISRGYYNGAGAVPFNELNSIGNAIDSYRIYSTEFDKTNFTTKATGFVDIPSIFYGSSLKKGSMNLKFFVTGTLVGELRDINKNGVLVETTGSSVGSKAGIVLYNHGIVLLTGSWELSPNSEVYEEGQAAQASQWRFWGTTGSVDANTDGSNVSNSSFSMEFQGVNFVNTITMLAHANVGELNHSNNPTYLSGTMSVLTSSTLYAENPNVEIRNIVQSQFDNTTGSFEKRTYISKIGIYDEDKNLIGITTLANPIRKRIQDDFTIKMKLDI